MIWKEAFGFDVAKPQRKDINDIHEIMKNSIVGWKPAGKKNVEGYGVQRCYESTESGFVDGEIKF